MSVVLRRLLGIDQILLIDHIKLYMADLQRHKAYEGHDAETDCDVAFFPGCSLAAYAPDLTREIFAALDRSGPVQHPDTDGAVAAMEAGDLASLCARLGNALEPVAAARRPGIVQALEALRQRGALGARMSGSGSAVFGLFDAWEKAAQAAVELKRLYPECCAAQSVPDGVKFL